MLKVNWQLVYAKAEELYPRFVDGLPFAQLEAELQAGGLDAQHINCVVEELGKMRQERAKRKLNIPILTVSIVVALLSILVLLLAFEGNKFAIWITLGLVFLFIMLRMLFKGRGKKESPRDRWRKST